MKFEYDYREVVTQDIINYIKENNELTSVEDVDALDFDDLYDTLMVSDAVTGNASGSYTFNRSEAADYVSDNTDILENCVYEGLIDYETIGENICAANFEILDVIIRCYLVPECLTIALETIRNDFE